MDIPICAECHHLFRGRIYVHEGEIFCSRHCQDERIAKLSWPDDRQGDLFSPPESERELAMAQ